MSLAKRMMELREEQRDEAIDIAVKAGVLERCDLHWEIVWDAFGDPSEAYKIANARFTAGELHTEFKSRRELTDVIKEVIEDSGSDGCPLCTKYLED